MYGDAVESFTGSLKIVKNVLANLATERQHQWENAMDCTPADTEKQELRSTRHCAIASVPQEHLAATPAAGAAYRTIDCTCASRRGLYVSPLFLSESATYECYEVTVEASVAIMFNLALSHHLNALLGSSFQGATLGVSTLEQAISLYELAYTVQMQEDAELNVEFAMAIINNLGHIHRQMGDKEKAAKCFGHLLSTMCFLQSFGGGQAANTPCQTEIFLYSISHLILQDTASAAA
jgi:hypothetical protein